MRKVVYLPTPKNLPYAISRQVHNAPEQVHNSPRTEQTNPNAQQHPATKERPKQAENSQNTGTQLSVLPTYQQKSRTRRAINQTLCTSCPSTDVSEARP